MVLISMDATICSILFVYPNLSNLFHLASNQKEPLKHASHGVPQELVAVISGSMTFQLDGATESWWNWYFVLSLEKMEKNTLHSAQNTVDGRNPANQSSLVVYSPLFTWLYTSLHHQRDHHPIFQTTNFMATKPQVGNFLTKMVVKSKGIPFRKYSGSSLSNLQGRCSPHTRDSLPTSSQHPLLWSVCVCFFRVWFRCLGFSSWLAILRIFHACHVDKF